jgi:hypothetical protein
VKDDAGSRETWPPMPGSRRRGAAHS